MYGLTCLDRPGAHAAGTVPGSEALLTLSSAPGAASLLGAERATSPSCSHFPGETKGLSLLGHGQPVP